MIQIKRELLEQAIDQLKAAQEDSYILSTANVIDDLEIALRQPDVIGTLPLSKVDGLLSALEDIKNWNDDLEDEWEDQGYRAIDALKKWAE